MHSPDHKSHGVLKKTTLKDKKKLEGHLYKGSLFSSPKSASSCLTTSASEVKLANRFDEHSVSFNKASTNLDLSIRHQAKGITSPKASGTMAGDIASPSSNRNPILQKGNEKTFEWKPLSKNSGISNKSSLFTAESSPDKPRAKAKGQFSDETRKNMVETPVKKVGMKMVPPPKDSLCMDEYLRPQSKIAVESPEKRRPNPITEGEPDKYVKPRPFEQQISEWTKKFNEKGTLLPSDRTGSDSTRLRQEKPSEMKALFEQSSTPKGNSSPQLFLSEALIAKKSGSAVKEVFNHDHYNNSKLAVSPKCSEVGYDFIKSNLKTERTYSRVKADIHI